MCATPFLDRRHSCRLRIAQAYSLIRGRWKKAVTSGDRLRSCGAILVGAREPGPLPQERPVRPRSDRADKNVGGPADHGTPVYSAHRERRGRRGAGRSAQRLACSDPAGHRGSEAGRPAHHPESPAASAAPPAPRPSRAPADRARTTRPRRRGPAIAPRPDRRTTPAGPPRRAPPCPATDSCSCRYTSREKRHTASAPNPSAQPSSASTGDTTDPSPSPRIRMFW